MLPTVLQRAEEKEKYLKHRNPKEIYKIKILYVLEQKFRIKM